MADLSLDEIIAAKKGTNFKVKFTNFVARKQFQGNTGQQKLQRRGFRTISNNERQMTAPKAGLSGPGRGQIDARDMITIKNRIKMPDARVKIVQRRVNQRGFDARSRLQPKGGARSQTMTAGVQQPLFAFQEIGQAIRPVSQLGFQQNRLSAAHPQQAHLQHAPYFGQNQTLQVITGNFTEAPSKNSLLNFSVTVDSGKSSTAAVGPLTRTLVNPLAKGGAVVENTGSSLKITRTVPDVSFDGKKLTVTRRLPKSSSKDQSSSNSRTKGPAGLRPSSRNSSASSARSGGPKAKMDRTKGPVIQVHNDRYRPLPSQAPFLHNSAKTRQAAPQNARKRRAPSPVLAPVPVDVPVKSSYAAQMSSKPAASASPRYSTSTRYKNGSRIPATVPSPKTPEPDLQAEGRLRPPPSASASSLSSKRLSQEVPSAQREGENPPVSSRMPSASLPASKRLAPRPSQQEGAPRASASAKPGQKRRAPMTLSERFAAGGADNPIHIVPEQVPVKRRRLPEPEPVKEEYDDDYDVKEVSESEEEEEETGVTLLSPLQGFRILVSNLHVTVTQDDIVELFGAIGALKRANLLGKGQAEVAFIHKEHSVTALKKYHNRELDGQPMFVKLLTPLNAKVMKTPASEEKTSGLPPSLRTSKKTPTPSSAPVEIPLIHRALFKTGGDTAPSKSVRFTVKL